MKKVLIVITTGMAPWGGLTTVMMNYYRAMDRGGLEIDFASTNIPDNKLMSELERNNSRYYCLGRRNKNPFLYICKLRRLLKEENYDVIHVNGNSATIALELWAAKSAGVGKRIAHIHSSRTEHNILHGILYSCFCRFYTDALACSQAAGKWIFKDRAFTVLNNAIDTERFRYNQKIRQEVRCSLGIGEDVFVVGTIGKLSGDKNHGFLFRVFKEYQYSNPVSVLLLVGDGEKREELKKMSNDLGIAEKVIFTGMREDNYRMLQAMDIFLFPSLFEGFGMALIEAQAAGLPCIASDRVPAETAVSEAVFYMSLKKPVEEWGKEISRYGEWDRRRSSEEACRGIAEHGYAIDSEAENLRGIYLGETDEKNV